MNDSTTIKITKATKKKLDQEGKKGETYEDIIIKLLTTKH